MLSGRIARLCFETLESNGSVLLSAAHPLHGIKTQRRIRSVESGNQMTAQELFVPLPAARERLHNTNAPFGASAFAKLSRHQGFHHFLI